MMSLFKIDYHKIIRYPQVGRQPPDKYYFSSCHHGKRYESHKKTAL